MREPNLFKRGGIYWLRATVKGVEHRESLRTRKITVARKIRDARLEEISAARHRGERRRPWLEAVTAWLEHSSAILFLAPFGLPFLPGRSLPVKVHVQLSLGLL